MAKGTVNVPGGSSDKVKPHAATHGPGGSDPINLSEIGAQEALSGKEGQYVGFDEEGNPVALDFPEFDNEDDSATGGTFYGTIGTDWTKDESSGVYIQVVPIEGVLAEHKHAIVDVVMTYERTSEGYAKFVEETNQFLRYVTNGDAETVDGGIRFYIYGEAPTISIPIIVEVG